MQLLFPRIPTERVGEKAKSIPTFKDAKNLERVEQDKLILPISFQFRILIDHETMTNLISQVVFCKELPVLLLSSKICAVILIFNLPALGCIPTPS